MTDLTHKDIVDRLEAGDDRFDTIDAALQELLGRTADIGAMREDVAATREVVEAWTTAKNAGRFIKWLSGVVAAITAMVVAVKVGIGQVR